jgi:hypothetical protein
MRARNERTAKTQSNASKHASQQKRESRGERTHLTKIMADSRMASSISVLKKRFTPRCCEEERGGVRCVVCERECLATLASPQQNKQRENTTTHLLLDDLVEPRLVDGQLVRVPARVRVYE